MKVFAYVAVAGAVFFAAPALAAEQNRPVVVMPAPAQPSATSVALAHRYINALHMPATMNTLMSKLTPLILAQAARDNGDKTLPPEFVKALTEATNEWMAESMPALTDKMAVITAEVFTEDELKALVDFYESPVGQSVMKKAPLMADHMGEVMQAISPPSKDDLMKRVCAKVDCRKVFAPQPDLKDDHKTS